MKTDNTYDIFDYLKWRADVPLSADPFNEVDQLILCELAYSDFEWLAGSNDGITIKDLQAEFFARNSREDLLARDSFIAKAPLLLDGMITGCRFSEMVMTDYIDEVDGDPARYSHRLLGLSELDAEAELAFDASSKGIQLTRFREYDRVSQARVLVVPVITVCCADLHNLFVQPGK